MSSLTFLYRWLFVTKARRQRLKGFTLIELLVSLVVASIVVSTLLYLVVELAKIDKREATLDQVQRDMKRAMEYITDDLQEAAYVYPNPERIASELKTDPAFPGDAGEVPILAFWRIDPIEDIPPNFNCSTIPTPTTIRIGQCQALKIRQASYTLVVYSQKTDNNNNRNWPGQSRIIRYELSQYRNVSTLDERPGYRDPTNSADAQAPFEVWKPNGKPTGFPAVLVDYVQTPNSPIAFNRAPLSDVNSSGTSAPCLGYGVDGSATPQPLYTVLPSDATTTKNNSFFACLRNPDPDNNADTANRANQDVYVFLRGSVQGASGGVNFFSQASSLPILETQVLVKGVVDKDLVDDSL